MTNKEILKNIWIRCRGSDLFVFTTLPHSSSSHRICTESSALLTVMFIEMIKSSLKQTLGDGKGQGSLACCSPWGHKEVDTTE